MINLSQQRLLVIAPHPDDEIFGCGGLIHAVKKHKGAVAVLYLTVGTTQDFSKNGSSSADERLREIGRVARRMRVDTYTVAFPGDDHHLQLDAMPQKRLIHEIERGAVSLESFKPTILAFPSFHDYNQDHRAANEAAISAARPVNGSFKHLPTLFLEYELPYAGWSPTGGPTPNCFLSLSQEALAAKLDALKLYESQMKTRKGPVSVYAARELAKMRGVLAAVDHAEAYVLRRIVVSS